MRALLLCTLLVAVAGCFHPQKPSCSYVCGDSTPKCPDDYECRADGYCHLIGSTDACLFSDAAVPLDMSMSIDMSMRGDMSSHD